MTRLAPKRRQDETVKHGVPLNRRMPRLVVEWLFLSSWGASLVTLLDTALLQRKRGYFTGGFLSVDHATKLPQIIGFLAGSLLADAAFIAPLIVLGLWMSSRLRLASAAGRLLALTAGVGPLLAANFISYRLIEYLSDTRDLSLMLELAGQHPSELFAVSSEHLLRLVMVLVGACLLTAAAVFILQRYSRDARESESTAPSTSRGLIALSAVPVFVGLVSVPAFRMYSDVLDQGLKRKPSVQVIGWCLARLTDFDGDGFGALSIPTDPDSRNKQVFPYAVDIPGNALDEDGIGGDLPPGPAYIEDSATAGSWSSRPNILLLVLESFRADVVGATLNGKPVTPVLNELAQQGVSSLHAYSMNGYTVQSRYHLFSGSLAKLRGATSLIDDFKANGYEVAYFSAQDESFGSPDFGIGFERADVSYDARTDRNRRYTTFSTPGSLAIPFSVLLERVESFLATRRSERPLFLYVNFHDTHFPYHHGGIRPLLDSSVLRQGDIRQTEVKSVRSMYLNTVFNVDKAVGELLSSLRERLSGNVGVIVTGDHGESLFEEGFLGHGYALNEAQTRIPLIVASLPLLIEEPFCQVDLRSALRKALSDRSGPTGPRLKDRAPGATIFQYLGSLARPRQIAFRTKRTQVIYDFRDGILTVDGTTWQAPRQLTGSDLEAFLHLIRFWERVRLAQTAKETSHQ